MTISFTTHAPGLDLPRGVSFWTNEGMAPPLMTPREVAHLFGRGRRWLTPLISPIGARELGTILAVDTPTGPGRRFTLHNVERLAHHLLERHAIDARRAADTLLVVKSLASLHGWREHVEALEQQVVIEREARG